VDRFTGLLQAMQTSFDEFNQIRRGEEPNQVDELIAQYDGMRSANALVERGQTSPNYVAMEQRIAELAAYNTHHYSLRLDQFIQIERYAANARSHPDQGDGLQAIQYYLQNVDDWGVYEVNLFKSCMQFFPASAIMGMLRITKKKVARFNALPGQNRLVINTYFTAISAFVAKDDFARAHTAHQAATTLVHQQGNVASAVLLPFMEGWIVLPERGEQPARPLFEQTLRWQEEMGLTKQHQIWTSIYNGLLDTTARGEKQMYSFS
jgi:Rgg/GadR/MutR family transcriptional activator